MAVRVKEIGVTEERAQDGSMEEERAEEVAGEVLLGAVGTRELGGSGDSVGPPQRFSSGWVTMLMLVMPASLMASMTEAKAPKGTRSSART